MFPKRYIFSILAMLATLVAMLLRNALNFAIIRMVPQKQTNDFEVNTEEKYDWDEKTQADLISSFYWGYLIFHIPAGLLAEKYGGKTLLGFSMLFTATLNTILPLAARLGFQVLFIVRVLEGIGEAVLFPAIYTLLPQWAPPFERGMMATIIMGGMCICVCLLYNKMVDEWIGAQTGAFLSNLLSGLILNWTSHWSFIFYIFGVLSFGWCILWYFFGYNDPASHPTITLAEKEYLEVSIGHTERKKNIKSTPWKSILLSPPVWTLMVAEVGQDFGYYSISLFLPKYMNDVLGINTLENGFASSLPFLAIMVFSFIASYISDLILKKKYTTVTFIRKLYVFISKFGPSVGIISASYAGRNTVFVTFMFIFAMACMAFSYSSLKVNPLELSPTYAGTLTAISNSCGCLSGVILPYLVDLLAPNETLEEWRVVYWVSSAVMTGTAMIFIIFGSCKRQEWDDPKDENPHTQECILH